MASSILPATRWLRLRPVRVPRTSLAVIALAVVVMLALLSHAWAQYQKKPMRTSKPRSYSDYYRGEIKRRTTPYGVRGAPNTPGKYVVDRYFYQRPTVSPYLNLVRPNSSPVSNYYSYTLPEQKRRQAEQQKQQQSRFKTPSGRRSGTPTTSYYNHWYSGRQALGLK